MNRRRSVCPENVRRLAQLAVLTVVVTVASGCSHGGSEHSAISTDHPVASDRFATVPLAPSEGVYFGVYYGDGTPADTDKVIETRPQINLTYFGWHDPWATSPVLDDDLKRGQISLVNWEPFDVQFRDIVAGDYDDLLTQQATDAAELKAPVFLDFAAEMNEEEGWGGHDAALYIAAYRHIHDIFEGRDGGNVVWVWAPNNVDSENAPPALDYYPGDDYVDWTGIDGYNWGTSDPDFVWQSFEDVFRDMYDKLDTLGKPIIIGETASAEQGGDKAAWISTIVPTLSNKFPSIQALVWFDVKKERDWRIRSSSAALHAFQGFAAAID